MTKRKKIALIVTISCLLLVIVISIITGILITNRNKAYGVEHKVLECEIKTASFDRSTNYLTMKLDYKLSIRNSTDKDYIYNADVLYLEVSGGDVHGGNGHYYKTFSNGERLFCFADVLGENTISTIPTNNGINSLSGTFVLKLFYPYAAWNSGFINTMQDIKFKLTYNGENVSEFKPDIKVTQVEGAVEG